MSASELFHWFSGGSPGYHTIIHCMNHDIPWMVVTVALDLAVASGYLVIASRWRQYEKGLRHSASKTALNRLKKIFIFCGLCGYLFIPIKLFWPAWRLYDFFMVVLAYLTWQYALKGADLKMLYRELGQADAMARDNAERERAAEEVRRSNVELERRVAERTAQLQAANNELEAFSYSVSHDLRAPLRSLDGFSLALMEDCADKLDAEGQDNLNRIRRASQRMGHLIDDLLNLARLTRVEMKRQTVDLTRMAQQAADDVCAGDMDRQASFVIAEGLAAEADPHLLRVVLNNLFANAWKFTAKRPDAKIEFGRTGQNDDCTFFVRDNGVGFDMAYAGKLFGAFQRLHTVHDFPGTGIGLATVQRIVRRHGGRIWAQGEVGSGATFHFTL